MLNILKNTINRVFASGVDSDASAFITATGLSGTTQKSAITTLVKDLKASGLWSKMKAVYPMVTDNYNLLSYTEDFSNAAWSKGGGTTVTANSTTAPNGTMTADTIVLPNTGTISQSLVSASTATYTLSIYLKASTNTTIKLGFFSPTNVVTCNVTTEWQRFTYTYSYSGTAYPQLYNDTGSTVTLYAWGIQAEQSSTATTYQPILTTPSAYMASQMKYNLKDARDLDSAFRLTWSGGWTYSATGATPNGTNAYADTKFNLVNNVPGYNNAFGVYYRTNNYGVYKLGALGASYDQGMSAHLGWQSAGSNLYNDNLGRNTIVNSAYGTFDAFHISTVTSTASQKLYRNGVLKLAGSATAGITLPSLNFYYGAANVNGTATYFDNQQWAFGILSTGLTDQDAQLLNQIVEKYQVALSRGVQAAQSFYYNSAYSNEANTYLYSTQITGTTQVSAINTLINGLKANNLWTKMKAVYPFVTDYRNLFAYTEDFSNAYWVKNNSSVTSNSAIAPNGTLTADTLIPNAGTNINEPIVYVIVDNTTQTRTISFYAKPAGYNYAYARIGGATPVALALFDLSNGTVVQTQAPAISASIESVGNGWYRCQMVYPNSPSLYAPNIGTCSSTYTISSTGITTTTNGTSGIYIWGAQLESGAQATPYQPVLAANSSSTFMSSQMKFNLVNPQDSDAAFRLAFSGGWTYSTNGAQPNGTNGYADTKLIPNTNLALNSASFSVYSRTNFTPLTNQSWGVSSSSLFIPLIGSTIDTTTRITSFVYDYRSPDGLNSATGLNFAAMFLTSRVSAASAKSYRNLTQLASVTTQGQTTQPTTSFTFGAFRNFSGFQDYNNFQYGFAHIGDGLTDAEIALFYQLVQDFQTTLSRQV